MRSATTLTLTILALVGLAPSLGAQEEQQQLPTPYTAEQIRDAWQEGLRLKTRVTTSKGSVFSITTVKEWSAEQVTVSDQPCDEAGEPVGEATMSTATWAELRDHARFPAASARRERLAQRTALGTLEGWLYTVESAPGGVTELFFADAYPGPPVVYGASKNGQQVMLAEMVELEEPGG